MTHSAVAEKRIRAVHDVIPEAFKRLNSAGIENSRLEAELLLAYCLNMKRLDLYMQKDTRVEKYIIDRYNRLILKRCSGIPLAYITGIQEFMGISLRVDERVLIPRPETELLVEHVLKLPGIIKKKRMVIIDVGTGSGAVAIALALRLQHATVVATDISREALAVARENIRFFQLSERMSLVQSDTLKSFRSTVQQPDIIISNPPYIKTGELACLQAEVRREPRIALEGGRSGREVLRRIIYEGIPLLKNGGYLVLEIDPSQKDCIVAYLHERAVEKIFVYKDYAGLDRIVIAKKN